MSAWSVKRRTNGEDQFWLVNLLVAGDLQEQTKSHPVHLNKNVAEANDENFTCFVDDGQAYINAVIQASAVKDFQRRCSEFAHSEKDIFPTHVYLKKYRVMHTLHNDQDLCEFWLKVDEFETGNRETGVDEFRQNDFLADCMTMKEVRESSRLLWTSAQQATQVSLDHTLHSMTLPFTQLTSEMSCIWRDGTLTRLPRADGTNTDLRAYLVKSFRTETIDFLMSDEDKRQLSLIEEWQADYRPPLTPCDSLTGSGRGDVDEEHGGSTPGQSLGGRQTVADTHVSGPLTGTTHVSGPLTGTTHVSGPLTGTTHVSGPLTGTTHVSGPLTGTTHVSGPLTGTTHVSGPLTGTTHISGPLTGTTHVSGPLTGTTHVGVQVHASQDFSQPLVRANHRTNLVDIGIQVGGTSGDRASSRTDDLGDRASCRTDDLGDSPSSRTGDSGDRASSRTGDLGDRPSSRTGDLGDRPSSRTGDSGDRPSSRTGDSGDRPSSRTGDLAEQDTDRDLEDGQIIRSTDGSADNSSHTVHLSTTRAEATVRPCFVSLCPLLDASLDTMLGCTDHSRRSDHSERSGHSRRSHQDRCRSHDLVVNPASATRSDSANTKVSGVKGWTCGHATDRRMTSTQVDYCPLEGLPCLDVSAVDRSVTDSVSVIAPDITQTTRHSSRRAARGAVKTRSNITQNAPTGTVTVNSNVHGAIRSNGVSRKHRRRNSNETVDAMTPTHDTSSDAMLLSDRQEERRLVELTKTHTKMSEAPSPVPSPVLVSRGRTKHKKTLHREPDICMPLSGSETFTQQPRRTRQAADPRWDIGALCAPKRQRKLRRVRKLYTEDILLPVEVTQVTAAQTNDTSLSMEVLTERTEGNDNSQPASCIIISSSSEHCTPVSPVDDAVRSSGHAISPTDHSEPVDDAVRSSGHAISPTDHSGPVDDAVRSSGHTISPTDHSDSVASTQLDASAVQRLELLFYEEMTPVQRKILELDFTTKDSSLSGFATAYFKQQKFGYTT